MVRLKHRYLLLSILYPGSDSSSKRAESDVPDSLKFYAPTLQHVTSRTFVKHLRLHIADMFGDHGSGVSLSNLKVIYFSHATSTVILRVPRSHHRIVWAALSFMNELPGPDPAEAGKGRRPISLRCVVKVVRVSGTIRKAEEELLRRSRKMVVQAKIASSDSQNDTLARLIGSDNHPTIPLSIESRYKNATGKVEDDSESE